MKKYSDILINKIKLIEEKITKLKKELSQFTNVKELNNSKKIYYNFINWAIDFLNS